MNAARPCAGNSAQPNQEECSMVHAMRIQELCSRTLLVALCIAGAVAFGTVAGAQTVTDDNVAEMMQSASKPADFQALSAYFNEKTAQATAAATRHKKMLAAVGQAGGKPPYVWTSHCQRLIRESTAQAADYAAMANAYKKLAAAAPKSTNGAPPAPGMEH
jgi:hypothetical protein